MAKQYCHIPQFIYLLDDTIKKNIALGIEDIIIDNEKIDKALRLSQSEKFVQNLPQKLETYVGEFGVRLSEDRDRDLVLQELYLDTDLLILDEATSSLDEETERRS